jgi:hypothetical protein
MSSTDFPPKNAAAALERLLCRCHPCRGTDGRPCYRVAGAAAGREKQFPPHINGKTTYSEAPHSVVAGVRGPWAFLIFSPAHGRRRGRVVSLPTVYDKGGKTENNNLRPQGEASGAESGLSGWRYHPGLVPGERASSGEVEVRAHGPRRAKRHPGRHNGRTALRRGAAAGRGKQFPPHINGKWTCPEAG